MRKILISMLLASAAASPAFAAPRDFSDRQAARQSAREDRQTARDQRQSARTQRQPNLVERDPTQPPPQVRQQRAPMVQAPAYTQQRAPMAQAPVYAQQRAAERSARQAQSAQRVVDRQAQSAQRVVDRQAGRNPRVDQRVQRTPQTREYFQQIREARRNARPPAISRTPQPNTQPPPPVTARPTPPTQWNTSWRNNSRYDWSNYRRRHNWLFNLGLYYDPFGWGYQPYQIGWRMWPSYFSNNYWLNDPWQYRLPYAPPGTRWIRYYDDAILVDMWSGQVVDVIYDFFW